MNNGNENAEREKKAGKSVVIMNSQVVLFGYLRIINKVGKNELPGIVVIGGKGIFDRKAEKRRGIRRFVDNSYGFE